MIRKRYSPEKIKGMLREAEVALSQGLTVGQICRQLSISEQTYHRWRKQCGGLKISQVNPPITNRILFGDREVPFW